MLKLVFQIFIFLHICCQARPAQPARQNSENLTPEIAAHHLPFDTTVRTIHVFVALCDNRFQGIVPVPAAIGNGQDPDNNLYWGCGYGVRTYFKKSAEWKLLKRSKPDSVRLERLVFKHRSKNAYLVADAYDGAFIEPCTRAFLSACAGMGKDTVHVGDRVIGSGGNAALLAYIGHNGLMDFHLTDTFENTDGKRRECIVLACASKPYFKKQLQAAGAFPLVWTTGLMCPEAYTLHDALTGYVNRESPESIRTRAAQAYSKYQKCSLKAARNLLVTGW